MSYFWPQDVLAGVERGDIAVPEAFRLLHGLDETIRPAETGRKQQPATARQNIDWILNDLDQLVGLTEVKKLVREIYAFVEIQKRREKEQLAAEPLALHMIFKGNPGTGKTTVARVLGRIFKEMGVLSSGKLIEIERADLVGEYIGHTAQKTREMLKKAYGGILFIDEAYSLARGGEKDFGKESIDVLVKAMEDHRDELILILAGYQQEMEEFLATNPGLRSRFPLHIDFPDYTQEELFQIAEQMCAKKQYLLAESAKRSLLAVLQSYRRAAVDHFGNARTVRNIIEKSIRRQAVRLIRKRVLTRNDLMLLESADLEEGATCGNS